MTAPARRVAVVTGGASGIGAAAARMYAAMGCAVALLDVDAESAREQAEHIAQQGGLARFYPCDVADHAKVQVVADQIAQEWGPADFLVTCAALIPNTESAMTMDLDAHDRMWRVNYHGTLHACRSFGAQMVAKGGGAIVTLTSINHFLALPLPAYNPGKVAISRLTQILAAELGRHGVRVNSVAPTYVMMPALRQRVEEGRRDLEKIMSVHALKRLPQVQDVAEAIVFLNSDKAQAITGVVLPVDAGWSSSVGYMTYAGGVPWDQAEGEA